MSLYQRLLARLLHYANAGPPWPREAFYAVKERLLRRYGRLVDWQWQEIRKECWGPWGEWYGERAGCLGEKCPRCGGTGIFDIRWVLLERWEWCGYVFYRPVPGRDQWTQPELPVTIFGRIEHRDYGLASREAALWLFLLTGHWRLLGTTLGASCSCSPGCWPMLRLQWLVMHLGLWLRWQKCSCGRWFPTWGSGRMVCRRCRRPTREDEIPF